MALKQAVSRFKSKKSVWSYFTTYCLHTTRRREEWGAPVQPVASRPSPICVLPSQSPATIILFFRPTWSVSSHLLSCCNDPPTFIDTCYSLFHLLYVILASRRLAGASLSLKIRGLMQYISWKALSSLIASLQWEMLSVKLMMLPNYALKAHLSPHKIRDSSRGAPTCGILHPL